MIVIRCETGDDVCVAVETLVGADHSPRNLHRALLEGQDLREADLSGSDLRSARLAGAIFDRAKPTRASLAASESAGARFAGADLKEAMKARAVERLSTLRLINAAIKDREIANRGDGGEAEVGEGDILAILGQMVNQRQESARAYEVGGRHELAEKELNEIKVIEEFLPRQLSADEVETAVVWALAEVNAASIRDMGRVMAVLKGKYTGQMDFGAVGPRVKDRLG